MDEWPQCARIRTAWSGLIGGREDRILWIDNAFPRLLTVSVADPKG
jgi:hypothetical protein